MGFAMWQLLQQRIRRIERHQLLLVIILVTVPLLAFVLASWVRSTGKGGQRLSDSSPRASSAVQRKPLVGESPGEAADDRDAPPAPHETLVKAQEALADAAGRRAAGAASEPHTVKPRTEGQAVIDEAMNAMDPRVGVTRVERFLSTLQNLQEASNAYAALGALYAQLGPEATAKSDSAFALALSLARSSEEIHHATCMLVRALMARNEPGRALEEAGRALSMGGELTLSGLELRMLQGQLLEGMARDMEAEEAYQKVREDSLSAAMVLGDRAMAVFRQACFALTRLYRRLGREADAETVTRLMKTRLDLHDQR